jgi:HK97 family phage prohead protease
MQRKARAGGLLKASDQGVVSVIFSTLNVLDHDGDVTLPGAFTDGQKVRVSAYNHASWGPSALPVGKGQIHEDGNSAIFDGQFFLNTDAGRETFETVKAMGDLQEWSFGFDVLDGGPGQFQGEQVNFLRKLNVFEVSPVLLGAGIGTRTVSAKGRSQTRSTDTEGLRLELQHIATRSLLRDSDWERLQRLIP